MAEHQVLPCRVFLSYAYEPAAHVVAVERFCRFLRSNYVDARMDLFVAERRVDWVLWTIEEIRLADLPPRSALESSLSKQADVPTDIPGP